MDIGYVKVAVDHVFVFVFVFIWLNASSDLNFFVLALDET